jgi:hypothetical protein
LLRTSLQFDLNKNFSTAAGILYGMDNYEAKTAPVWMIEKRLFQQCFLYRRETGKITIAARISDGRKMV